MPGVSQFSIPSNYGTVVVATKLYVEFCEACQCPDCKLSGLLTLLEWCVKPETCSIDFRCRSEARQSARSPIFRLNRESVLYYF